MSERCKLVVNNIKWDVSIYHFCSPRGQGEPLLPFIDYKNVQRKFKHCRYYKYIFLCSCVREDFSWHNVSVLIQGQVWPDTWINWDIGLILAQILLCVIISFTLIHLYCYWMMHVTICFWHFFHLSFKMYTFLLQMIEHALFMYS